LKIQKNFDFKEFDELKDENKNSYIIKINREFKHFEHKVQEANKKVKELQTSNQELKFKSEVTKNINMKELDVHADRVQNKIQKELKDDRKVSNRSELKIALLDDTASPIINDYVEHSKNKIRSKKYTALIISLCCDFAMLYFIIDSKFYSIIGQFIVSALFVICLLWSNIRENYINEIGALTTINSNALTAILTIAADNSDFKMLSELNQVSIAVLVVVTALCKSTYIIYVYKYIPTASDIAMRLQNHNRALN